MKEKARRRISLNFVSTLAALLVQPVISSVVNGISRRGVRRTESLVPLYHLSNIEITNYFSYEPRLSGTFQEIIYLE